MSHGNGPTYPVETVFRFLNIKNDYYSCKMLVLQKNISLFFYKYLIISALCTIMVVIEMFFCREMEKNGKSGHAIKFY